MGNPFLIAQSCLWNLLQKSSPNFAWAIANKSVTVITVIRDYNHLCGYGKNSDKLNSAPARKAVKDRT